MSNNTSIIKIKNYLANSLESAGVHLTTLADDATDDEYATLTYDNSAFDRNNRTPGFTITHTFNLEVKLKAKNLDLDNLLDKLTTLLDKSANAFIEAERFAKEELKNLMTLTPVGTQTDYGAGGSSLVVVAVMQVKATLSSTNLI